MFLFGITKAQDVTQFDLQQCIAYALENHENIKNAQLDIKMAEADIKQIRGTGLPQISAGGEFNYFFKIPKTVVDVSAFNPLAPEGTLEAIPFGVDFSTKGSISASQLLFSGSYIVGLQAAKAYKDLMISSLDKSKTDVVEAVTKAYYNVMIANESIKIVQANVSLLDTLYHQTQEMFKAGFVEELQAQQALVKLNNLKIEQENAVQLKELAYQLLKFQMGMDANQPFDIAENIEAYNVPIVEENENIIVENRQDYQLLNHQKKLLQLNIKNNKSVFLPTLAGFANYGKTNGVNTFGDVFDKTWWFPSGVVGLNLSIPIFSGLQNQYKIKQSTYDLQKTQNQLSLLERSIKLQVGQSKISLTNAIATLSEKKKNMELSEKVYLSTLEKYKTGMNSMFEVTSSYTDFRTSQIAYLEGIYNVVVAKLELDKAKGELKY